MKICKWCKKPVEDETGDECNNCWEMRHRIENHPQVAIKILKRVVKNIIIQLKK